LIFELSFCKKKKNWSDILSSASAKSGISTFLQLLQFGISVLSLQLFRYFFFSSISVIWYLRSISAKKIIIWSDILSSASAKSGISTVLQLLQFGISVCLCNCFGISSSLQFLQFGISFCNLVFMFCLWNYFGISSSLQFLQFGI